MDEVLRHAKREESVILRGGNCDGHDMSDSVRLIRDHEKGVIYALYDVSWLSDYHVDNTEGVNDFSYCFSFKEDDMVEAIAKLRVKRPNTEADPTAVEPVAMDSTVTEDPPEILGHDTRADEGQS